MKKSTLNILMLDTAINSDIISEKLNSLGYNVHLDRSCPNDLSALIQRTNSQILLINETDYNNQTGLNIPIVIIGSNGQSLEPRTSIYDKTIHVIHPSCSKTELKHAIENAFMVHEITKELHHERERVAQQEETIKNLTIQLEQQKEESENRFKLFMDFIPAAIFIKDKEGKALYLNKYFSDQFNADGSWIGKKTTELFPEEISRKMRADDDLALRKGYYVLEETIPDKNGCLRVFQTHKFTIKTSDSTILIGGIGLDITEENAKLKALRESEEHYRVLFEGAGEGILIAETKTKNIIYANPAIATILGYSIQELTQMNVRNIHPQQDLDHIMKEFEYQYGEEKVLTSEIPCLRKDGSILYADISTTKLKINNNDCDVGFFTDITERKQAQDQIKGYLAEKETLLKEIHHRVKNNLQIITSLLDLQLNNLEDEKTKNIFISSMNRIYSMSLVHEMLYQSSHMSMIDFSSYIHNLIKGLQQTITKDHQHIMFTLNIEHINLALNKAIPCGLIINELISNALKHAFTKTTGGKIIINFSTVKDLQNKLIIHDNGKGLPDDFDITKTKSLGLLLVRELTNQLKGNLVINNKSGAYFEITFSS